MRRSNDFFTDLKEWSDRKLCLLTNYLDPAVKILGKVYQIDGFAGPGVYSGSGAKGSPVRAAELARQYQMAGKMYALRCINVERDEDLFANLVAATAEYGNLVLNLQGTFGENVDRIRREIGNYRAVVFLDPFGIKGVPWSAVQKIIGRSAPTDLWIRFDASIVRRLDGFFEKTSPGADKKFDILTTTYGIANAADLHARLAAPTPEERIRTCVQLYMDRLSSEFKRVRGKGYAAAYSIRSLSNQHKYYLIFATAHEKGYILASETVCGIEETYQRELEDYKDGQTLQPRLFSLDPTEEEIFNAKVEELAEDIWDRCAGDHLVRTDIYIRILGKWFGRIRARHLNRALERLRSDGRIIAMVGTVSQDQTRFTFRQR